MKRGGKRSAFTILFNGNQNKALSCSGSEAIPICVRFDYKLDHTVFHRFYNKMFVKSVAYTKLSQADGGKKIDVRTNIKQQLLIEGKESNTLWQSYKQNVDLKCSQFYYVSIFPREGHVA